VGRVPPGSYLALLSHSGSRRFGYEAAEHYTQIARRLLESRLPKEYLHLAWLELGKEGDEYWAIMTLAGRYASANHAVIHRRIISDLRFEVLDSVENHHNFAWKEIVDGIEAVVHRKGATPAGLNMLGVIPGSMSAPGYIVKGKGSQEGINSAAHGAGRQMSRGEAFRRFNWDDVDKKLQKANVDLISAGLDEAPAAYKDIHQVMEAQADLVEPLAEFQPRIVKMAPPERGGGRGGSGGRSGGGKKKSSSKKRSRR
jgi:tRNA-splicing ligase RtcB